MTEHWACPRHPDTFARVKFNGGRLWCHDCKAEIPDAIKVVVVRADQLTGAVDLLHEVGRVCRQAVDQNEDADDTLARVLAIVGDPPRRIGCPACAPTPEGPVPGPGCEQCDGAGWVWLVPNE